MVRIRLNDTAQLGQDKGRNLMRIGQGGGLLLSGTAIANSSE